VIIEFPSQHAKCISLTVICSLSGYWILFHSISNAVKICKKNKLISNMCFGILYKYIWKVSNFKRTERHIMQNVYWSSCKKSVTVVITQWNLNFLDGFSKNNVISNFIEIRQVVPISFIRQTDERADGSADRNFCDFKTHSL
jgi:hypothetical protein